MFSICYMMMSWLVPCNQKIFVSLATNHPCESFCKTYELLPTIDGVQYINIR